MSKQDAALRFAALIRKYGVKWTAAVPSSAYEELQECSRFLSERERRDITFVVQGVGGGR